MTSLSSICSILVGFSLAGLVQLGTDVGKVGDSAFLPFAVGCWLFSSFLLLVVLVLAELHRRQEVGDSVIDMPPQECLRFARRCERLLSAFSVALLLTAVGFVLLGFHFSIWHGLVACLGALAAVTLLFRALR